MSDRVAGLFGEAVEVGFLIVVLALRVVETGAAEEIEIRFGELLTYLIIFIAIRHVRVEGCGGCVVDGDRGHDTDAPALCFEFLRYRREVCGVGIQTKHAVAGLGASSETSACCGRVGDAVGSRIGRSVTRIGESGHERLDASEGLPLNGRTIHLGEQDLVRSHAVTDEVEEVFDFRERVQSTEYRVQNNENSFHIGDWLLVIGDYVIT